MSNFDTVVLDGEMGLFTKVREGDLPYYTGATEVTPSDTTQVLETADTIVTENITINPIPDMDLEEVQVTYTPDEEGQTDTITPSTGYVGIAEVEVTVEPIDSNYVGSGIARNDSDDLTASGATVIAPAGYYEEAATKSVASGSATTPDTSITANPTISVGNDGSITASVSATQSVTPTVSAGYVSSGTAGNITVSGSGSAQLSTQAAATIIPSTSQQTAVAAGKFTTGAVVVDKIPSQYIVPTGTKSISANGTGIDVTEYAAVDVAVPGDTPTLQTKSVSYTPTESQQTAAVTHDTGYDGLDQVNVTVGAIDSEYVGSDVPRRSSTDLSASGATVTVPAGYYASSASKAVASGTAGTPSATKGEVSNHSVSVTPSVTNTAGYISGGTISGTAVTVDVAELESGTKTITENGTGISVSGYSAVDVNVSGGGGSEAEEKAVNFYDYDGTRVDSYTAQEFAALTELPANPSHTGLTAQGWNWSLADAKTYVASHGLLAIGQMYITSDGTTQIDITLSDPYLSPYLSIAPNGTLSVDWGDGSAAETVTGSNLNTRVYTPHVYSSAGDYTIKITVVSGSFSPYVYQTDGSSILSDKSGNEYSQIYANCIKAVRLGSSAIISNQRAFQNCASLEYVTIPSTQTSVSSHNMFNGCASLKHITIPTGTTTIQGYTFEKCYSLKSISLPKSVSSLKGYSFENCYNLRSITASDSVTTIEAQVFKYCTFAKRIIIPDTLTSLQNQLFQQCNALESITLPSGLTSIGNNCFNACRSLTTLTIPSTVTTISSDAFAGCRSMQEYHFKSTTPPSLGNVNVFFGIPENCVIYVPQASLDTYKGASTWSNYASKMVGE